MTMRTVFSDQIFRRRTERKLTQEQVAEAIGMTVRGYQYLERGEHQPSLENFIKLALLLDLRMEDFRTTVVLQPIPNRK
ncbi:MAG: helix-turn-helix transcriptional regulator [Clostridiales bacterium]|nr:helix-turn-helix transcriptional regulator [Clostridiales bacterium]